MTNYRGEIAALSTAILWAIATVIYGRVGITIAPLILNAIKGILAIASIGLTIIIFKGEVIPLPLTPMLFLLASGAIGIGLGDTAFFNTLKHLGARRTLLLETLAPPLTALLAAIFLNEQLTLQSWGGIFLTVTGVAWVITERSPQNVIAARNLKVGVFWGILAELAQATGAVLSRTALLDTVISPLWSSLLRISAGVAIALLLIMLQGRQGEFLAIQWSWRVLGLLAVAALIGTHLAIWLQQTGLKYAPAGVAQTLASTSPLFVLPLAALQGDRITGRALGGVCLAIAGIGLLFA
ncbi:MAG: DMT family transporter [Jaaginema sp. PMC 1079.18]|nr:DMT family transporter [Jaaginema sp. PMC 1080.18]MEC4852952.1 DMT family transporter [Jaaginema sp. PMC 1079.18]MEC4864831.1 DMT family transporter [Jaaginema sp. PMC 1078.18]